MVLVKRWQKTAGTALCEAVQGAEHWDTSTQILAMVYDVLQHANWQRASKRSAPKPKRLQRPWEKARVRKFGSDPIPISKFDEWWNAKARKRNGRRRRARDSMGAPGPLS